MMLAWPAWCRTSYQDARWNLFLLESLDRRRKVRHVARVPSNLETLVAQAVALSPDDRRELEVALAIARASPEVREGWMLALDLENPADLQRACTVLLLNEAADTIKVGSSADVAAVGDFFDYLTASAVALAADLAADEVER
jgi:hypothetical protein